MAQLQIQDLNVDIHSQSLSAVSRTHSVDGTVSGNVKHFYPYLPVFSEGASVPLCPPSRCGSDLCSESLWDKNHTGQLTVNQCNSSKYSFQKYSSTCAENAPQFPKPIYSYSILIFLALKNSKSGSLPVSEIYSFMTEHFPYFKTAPDGWKNSVRHNLSLNKCFEKVENKNGNSSRKGCLWALNPAKVDKMQEELHKWRRKDPGTVRRSMAKPEDLDHLLREKPNKFRSLTTCCTTRPCMFSSASHYGSEHARPPSSSSQHFPKYLSHSTPHQPDLSYALYPSYNQHVAPSRLLSPRAGKMPPPYSVALRDEHSRRSMHDLLMDGDAGCDIDALNPSLTDLQLQGSLWEELKQDSARVVPSLSPSTLEAVTNEQSCYLNPTVPCTSERVTNANNAHYVDKDPESMWVQDENYECPLGVYSELESFTGCLSSSTTSVSLM
ncbi:hypothetical protein WMY93_028264 [Mugilogobius chulae]|uniref:Fork-head domain-containing protein n=1 Tax=Mugilogobius chulae TaxID=88201 RepID=A0AAW0MPR6_9GOBI